MRIISNGMNNPDGIYMECPVCSCKWVVEDRHDMKHHIVIIPGSSHKKIVEYIILCPECDYCLDIGVDPNLFHEITGNFLCSSRNFIFNRPDWKEKYEVSAEGKEVSVDFE